VQKARLIYNPAAGRFPAGMLLDRAVRVLGQGGWSVEVVEPRDGEELPDLVRRAVQDGCAAVFVAGGDGTVGQVAAQLAGSSTALGVLPAGTANVWARELGLPALDWTHWFALETAAARLARAAIRLVDLGECNGRSFLLWAGVGLDARIVNNIEPRERWEKVFGNVHYATLAVWQSLNWQGVDLKVTSGSQTWEGRFLVAVASNIRSYAGGLMELSPEARVDDGLLDFWLVSGRSMMDAVLRVVQVVMGTHVDAEGVVHFQASEAAFEAEGNLPMQFDGEPHETASPARFSVRSRTLRVLVPAGTRPRLFTRPDASKVDG
jgi:YegS/Rv2252/BmrU family lipid kinase